MTNQIATNEERSTMIFTVADKEVKLSPNIVQQFITKGNGAITNAEAINFMQLCKYQELNPFLNEAYLIKFGNQPAQMVVAKEALLKRANREPDFGGMTSGIVVLRGDDVVHKEGQLVYPKETLLGGWAKVIRKNFENSIYAEVGFSEYDTGKSTWAKMPANMINKVAEAAALRKAYPEQLGSMYTEEEPTAAELESTVKDVSNEKTAELLSDFKGNAEDVETEAIEHEPIEAEVEVEDESE